MYDCVYNPKYSVHNSLSEKILLHLCLFILISFFDFALYSAYWK